MSKCCAYCFKNETVTREHIFPAGVISKYKSLIATNDKVDFGFRGDLTIKDVCARCNNGPLSQLDTYFVETFVQYMAEPILPGNSIDFRFDYHLLKRFLLKVSYNSARASISGKLDAEAMKHYISYILGEAPIAKDVMMRLQIYTSAKKVNKYTGVQDGFMEARLLRSAKVPYEGNYSNAYTIRLVVFNSFWFLLFVPIKPISRIKKERFIKGFDKWKLNSGVLMSPHKQTVHIPANQTTYIHPEILKGMFKPEIK